MKKLETVLSDDEHAQLVAILEKSGQSAYSFLKEAVLKEMRTFQESEGGKGPSAIIQEMVEVLAGRKRFIYQMGPYSDDNHRHWIAGRFPHATKREVVEAVAAYRAAGGKV